ncbi:MAG: hypothetical protein NTZ50_07595 [Chloroflexi bacterium]|nr:hypothetical protein [Chloroflexota bacterium]
MKTQPAAFERLTAAFKLRDVDMICDASEPFAMANDPKHSETH